eukprot:1799815-Rhodomonas_salina.3
MVSVDAARKNVAMPPIPCLIVHLDLVTVAGIPVSGVSSGQSAGRVPPVPVFRRQGAVSTSSPVALMVTVVMWKPGLPLHMFKCARHCFASIILADLEYPGSSASVLV